MFKLLTIDQVKQCLL